MNFLNFFFSSPSSFLLSPYRNVPSVTNHLFMDNLRAKEACCFMTFHWVLTLPTREECKARLKLAYWAYSVYVKLSTLVSSVVWKYWKSIYSNFFGFHCPLKCHILISLGDVRNENGNGRRRECSFRHFPWYKSESNLHLLTLPHL